MNKQTFLSGASISRLPAGIAILFLFLVALLTGLVSIYWLNILEPQLATDARTHARALAQAHALNLSSALSRLRRGAPPQVVEEVLNDALVLRHAETDTPFIVAIELELDLSLFPVQAAELELRQGEDCSACIGSTIPLYDNVDGQLIALAHFHSSNRFALRLKSEVREKLFIGSGILIISLLAVWRLLILLFNTATRSEANFRKLFEATPFPMALTKAGTGQVLRFNKAASRFFKLESAKPQSLYTVDFYKNPEQRQTLLEQLSKNGYLDCLELEVKTDNGMSHWMLVSIYPLAYHGEEANLIGMVDISTLKQVQDELEGAKNRAEAATEAKSRFLANMSHEIRTPISGVLGLAELLEKTSLNPEQQHYVSAIHSSMNTLLNLINDILDISRIEAGKLVIKQEAVDLHQLVKEATQLVGPRAEQKGLSLECSIDEAVPRWQQTDSLRLQQVLLNLLGNAVKFTETGTVRLTLSLQESDSEKRIHFSVSDTGPGIDSAFLQRLFEPFSQADTSNARGHGGTGLGLSISHRLVQLMGGAIEVASTLGKGTTLTVRLPLRNAEAPVEAVKTADTLPERFTAKVLLAEDDAINRLVAQRFISDLGCEVDTANDGHEALALLEQRRYDLILMDRNMPGMDGLQATTIIRSREAEGEHVPIIALTANAMTGDRETSLASGMDDHLSKPLKVEQLRELLARYCPHTAETDR